MVYIMLYNWESIRIRVENSVVVEWDILPIDCHIFPIKIWSEVKASKTDFECYILSIFFEPYFDKGAFIIVVYVLNQYLLSKLTSINSNRRKFMRKGIRVLIFSLEDIKTAPNQILSRVGSIESEIEFEWFFHTCGKILMIESDLTLTVAWNHTNFDFIILYH